MGNSSLNTTEANADLGALLERATRGPWQANGSHFYGPDPKRVLIGVMWGGEPVDADLALIARAPDLAAEVLCLRAEARETALQYLSDTGQMSERIDDLTVANAALAADNARMVTADHCVVALEQIQARPTVGYGDWANGWDAGFESALSVVRGLAGGAA